jgi:hypothetical protein
MPFDLTFIVRHVHETNPNEACRSLLAEACGWQLNQPSETPGGLARFD